VIRLYHYDLPKVADSGEEFSIQVRLRRRMADIAPKVRLVATPNGGQRSAWSAMRVKAEGLQPGFPDLTALWAGGGVAFLEIKDHDGALDGKQIDWLNWLHLAGFPCGCFRSVDTAVAFLQRAGAPFLDAAA